MAPRKPSSARLISAPSLPPRVIHFARQLREAAQSMAADPKMRGHEKRTLLSAAGDLGEPLEKLADKIKDDPNSDVALWFVVRATFLIGNHVSEATAKQIMRRGQEKRATKIKAKSDKIDEIILRVATENPTAPIKENAARVNAELKQLGRNTLGESAIAKRLRKLKPHV